MRQGGDVVIITASKARANLYRLIDHVTETEEPVYITGKRGNVVVLSEDDYRDIQETLALAAVPGMRDKILSGMAAPLSECVEIDEDA
jgi:prevent-host-death family protein